MEQDREFFMRHAIELARRGEGKVNPNPLVGAVVVKNGCIIGEGWHERYGELHAERHALSRLTESAEGAQMYVTLEPCCHHGKQPPCTQALIEHGISKVYVGSDDPNALVAGGGILALREAGIEVETGVLKEECDALNPVFFHYITTKTPYVVMKYAMSLDGKIACDSGKSRWITGEQARAHVQRTRNALTGIMVGVQTVLLDNPSLTCRIKGGRNPVRIICDTRLRIPLESEIVQTAREVSVLVATTITQEGSCLADEAVSGEGGQDEEEYSAVVQERKRKRERLEEAGVEIVTTASVGGMVDLRDLMIKLGERGIDSILLEGGGTLNESALKAGIVNHVQVYIAPKLLGGSGRYTPVRGEGVFSPSDAYPCCHMQMRQFGDDILLEYDCK